MNEKESEQIKCNTSGRRCAYGNKVKYIYRHKLPLYKKFSWNIEKFKNKHDV